MIVKKRQRMQILIVKSPIWGLQHCNTCCPAKRYHLAERRPKMCAPRTRSRPGDVLGQPFPSYSKWVLQVCLGCEPLLPHPFVFSNQWKKNCTKFSIDFPKIMWSFGSVHAENHGIPSVNKPQDVLESPLPNKAIVVLTRFFSDSCSRTWKLSKLTKSHV